MVSPPHAPSSSETELHVFLCGRQRGGGGSPPARRGLLPRGCVAEESGVPAARRLANPVRPPAVVRGPRLGRLGTQRCGTGAGAVGGVPVLRPCALAGVAAAGRRGDRSSRPQTSAFRLACRNRCAVRFGLLPSHRDRRPLAATRHRRPLHPVRLLDGGSGSVRLVVGRAGVLHGGDVRTAPRVA
jgi:hypothetical protein